jgi:hypothetical protein
MTTLNPADHQDLGQAVNLLENPSFAAKVTNLIGGPVEKAITMLPDGVSEKLVGRLARPKKPCLKPWT